MLGPVSIIEASKVPMLSLSVLPVKREMADSCFGGTMCGYKKF